MKSSHRRPKGTTKARPQAVTLARGRAPSKAQQQLELFKAILQEAAELYGILPNQVTTHQYDYVSAGRLHSKKVAYIAPYGKLRAYCFPTGPAQLRLK